MLTLSQFVSTILLGYRMNNKISNTKKAATATLRNYLMVI